MITITLQKIRDNSPRVKVWERVFSAHKHLGMDDEFPLTDVLESNDLDDTLWCTDCLPEYKNLWRKYSVWCARQVEHLMTDERSKKALDVAWRHSDGLATDDELAAARDAARAVLNAPWTAAGAAGASWASWAAGTAGASWASWGAGTIAGAAAEDVWEAAGAAGAAAGAAMLVAKKAQQKKLIEILNAGEWVD